jgi:hypothetical protein
MFRKQSFFCSIVLACWNLLGGMDEGKVNFELGILTWLNKNQGEIIMIHVEFL